MYADNRIVQAGRQEDGTETHSVVSLVSSAKALGAISVMTFMLRSLLQSAPARVNVCVCVFVCLCVSVSVSVCV